MDSLASFSLTFRSSKDHLEAEQLRMKGIRWSLLAKQIARSLEALSIRANKPQSMCAIVAVRFQIVAQQKQADKGLPLLARTEEHSACA